MILFDDRKISYLNNSQTVTITSCGSERDQVAKEEIFGGRLLAIGNIVLSLNKYIHQHSFSKEGGFHSET